jgi:putative SOS response-associated peptidase YedK
MPVVVPIAGYDPWLDRKLTDPATAAGIIAGGCPDSWIESFAVSRLVNSAKNDGPECLAPSESI